MYEVKDNRFKIKADSVIDSNTDSKFRKSIRYARTWECYYDTSDMNSQNWSGFKSVKGVSVYYDFVNNCNQEYMYQTNGLMRGGFEITFDFKYKIVKKPDFVLLKSVAKIYDSCFISYDSAQSIAIKNSRLKSKKTWTNYLVYNVINGQIYYQIDRETGFRKGVIETIKINATNGKVYEKTEIPFYTRNIVRAIWDNIGKVP